MSVRRVAGYLKLTAFAALASILSMPAHAGSAPDPTTTREPVVQVYGARTMGVKGIFGVHTWVAVKPANAMSWTVYEIIGWRLRWSDSALVIRERQPDAPWFGSAPELYADKRGPGVAQLIARIDKAAHDYPYAGTYTLWPGPNSNTFTAWIARAVPELQVDLPSTAVGKDYIGTTNFVSTAPSGTGFQFTLAGLFGVVASPIDGFELNLLGLNFGVSGTGVKLPMVGRIGMPHFFETATAKQ
ncbi:MAG TPA: DUF3750 domain-containing protein [Burkholderiales bacterium]|nr:DUF3750 domain-containing protein [Burkholderiales bacterium]